MPQIEILLETEETGCFGFSNLLRISLELVLWRRELFNMNNQVSVPLSVRDEIGLRRETVEDFAILEAVGNAVNRKILRCADPPMTVKEISNECDIPLSTAYRRVEELTEVGILREQLRVMGNGLNPAEYQRTVDEFNVRFDDEM